MADFEAEGGAEVDEAGVADDAQVGFGGEDPGAEGEVIATEREAGAAVEVAVVVNPGDGEAEADGGVVALQDSEERADVADGEIVVSGGAEVFEIGPPGGVESPAIVVF